LDGELTLLALDSKHRGKGISQSLVQSFKAIVKYQQSRDYYLYTENNISTFLFMKKRVHRDRLRRDKNRDSQSNF
jgi:GNAT superfamily N-acetyltransferase